MGAMARALYRGRQFFGAVRPRVDPSLRDEAFRLLREPERRLFESMTLRDQQHGLAVYRRLLQQGADHDLLVAALLHDAGKGRIALWHRVAFVLLEAWAPGILRRLAASAAAAQTGARMGGWRQALYRCLHHHELGAKLAEEAGSSERVVVLIRGDAQDDALATLRAADDSA